MLTFVYNLYPISSLSSLLNKLNIVFSFVLVLIVLRMLDSEILKSETKIISVLDNIMRFVVILFIVSIYFYIKIDYGLVILAIALVTYAYNKSIYTKELINKNEIKYAMIKIFAFAAIYVCTLMAQGMYSVFFIFGILMLLLYN